MFSNHYHLTMSPEVLVELGLTLSLCLSSLPSCLYLSLRVRMWSGFLTRAGSPTCPPVEASSASTKTSSQW